MYTLCVDNEFVTGVHPKSTSGPPPLFTPYLLNARQLGVYTSQAPPHLLEPTMPTLALPTVVQPTPAPVPSAFGTQQAVGYAASQHNVAVTPATGLGVNVAPVTLLLEQVTQPIVGWVSCADHTFSRSNRASAYGTPLDGATVKVVITTVNKT